MKLKQLNPFEFTYNKLTPLWISVFVDILGFSILIPFLPFFAEKFGARAWQIGLLLSTNALFGFFSGPIWGNLSDKYGRKPMLLLSQVGTTAGFFMLAFSNSLFMLFASRIVDGVFGGNYPIAKAIIGDVVPSKDRSEQMSNIGVAHVLSSLIGPGLGGMLSQWGILAPGLVAAAMTIIALAVTFFFLDETNPYAELEPDFVPQAASPEATAAQGGKQQRKVTRADVWRNLTARYFLIQWGFHTLSFMLYVSSISLFANLKLGMNAQEVGWLLMISGAVRVFIRFVVFVPLRRRIGDRRTSLLGLGLFVLVYLALGFVETPFQFGLVLSAASFAAACSRGILSSFLSQAVEPWQQGTAMGLSSSLDSFAQIVGPLAGGIILDSLALWVYGAVPAFFAAGAFVMAVAHFPLSEQEADAQDSESEEPERAFASSSAASPLPDGADS